MLFTVAAEANKADELKYNRVYYQITMILHRRTAGFKIRKRRRYETR
jgi:hypothetical protein